MFEKLNDVNWNGLGHAYGSAADVPGLLRKLASSDKDDRKKAIYELYGNIWHQGTVYEATAHAVPFLIELVDADRVQDKHEILLLLAHLAKGNSYKDVHRHLPLYDKLFAEEMATAKWQAELQQELSWVRNANEAVMKGKPTYLRLLAAEQPSVRDAAGYLLAALGGPAQDVVITLLANSRWRQTQRSKPACCWRMDACVRAKNPVRPPWPNSLSPTNHKLLNWPQPCLWQGLPATRK
jgi:hypothetical protein